MPDTPWPPNNRKASRMKENIRTAEAVGLVTIDWQKRSIEMEGIGGHDQMTAAEVIARLARPTAPGVEVHAMVLWDTGSTGYRRMWQLCWYNAADIEADDDDETDDSVERTE
jgi:hypothetical protein